MASRNTTSPISPAGPKVQRSNGDSARWIAGLVLLFAGLFAFAAVFFSFFTWKADQSVLTKSVEERELLGKTVSNLCGWSGARLSWLLVDASMGVCGILVPVMIMLVGVRIIRRRPLLLNHSILTLFLVMILGSLTLGFLFGHKWSFCCSTGWGGEFGIGVGTLLRSHIGVLGTVILLLVCWMLVGVFINRNFINTVNSAGSAVVDRSERFVGMVRHRVAPQTADPEFGPYSADGYEAASLTAAQRQPVAPSRSRSAQPQSVAAFDSSPVQAGAAAHWAPEERFGELSEDVYRPQPETPEIFMPASQPAVQSTSQLAAQPTDHSAGHSFVAPSVVASAQLVDDDPFTEIMPGEPEEEPAVAPAAAPVPTIVSEDDEFIEFDLSEKGRVVMGRGGLVELEHEKVPEPIVDGPFMEITVPQDKSRAAQPAATVKSAGGKSVAPDPAAPAAVVPPRGADGAADVAAAGSHSEPSFVEQQSARTVPADSGVVVTVESHRAALVDERAIPTESYDPLKDLVNYRKPPVTLLEDYVSDSEVSDEEIFENKSRIEETLKYFGIPIQRIKATVGPTVTLYEIVQAQGVKISKIQGLENDIAQSLKALGIRIIAPIPGKGTIGIEVPNRDKQIVSMYSAVRSLRFQESKAELPVVIGRTIQNENYVFDLAKMPHLLVAGATGQGKSVGLNAIIASLLYRKHPAQLKFVMIDPKMVEFSLYAKIERHFLAKMESEENSIVTDPMKAVYTLNSLCTEMDNRLKLCSEAGARNIIEYNEKFTARRLNPNKGHRYLPYIVVVVDEFADLIMMAREVERPVMRLAQKARAVGIHLIIATQRPDVKVITGGIKANFPARIAFRVMQMIDSRTIIDQPGANQLIGRGDMLFSKDGELTRIQCALVETRDVERVVEHIARQQGYAEPYPLPDYVPEGGEGAGMGSEEAAAPLKYDVLFAEIARNAVESGSISTSMIQRNYEVGFNRAGRIMMQLERAGIVGRQLGAKPRDILFHDLPSLEAKLQELGVF